MKRDPEKLRAWQRRSKPLKRSGKVFRAAIHPASRQKTLNPPKARKKLKKVSTGRQREMRLYYEERTAWLLLPKNAACAICLCLGEHPRAATEVHHARSRSGRLLRDQRFWVSSCRQCREIPHARPAWAREMGILSTAAEWGVYPGDL